MNRKILLSSAVIVVASVAGVATAFAAKQGENDALAIAQAKTTLTQAIATAEQAAGGKAARAEFEHSKQHGWVYNVEVVNAAKVFDVKIDSDKGTVIASVEDQADHGGKEDEND